MQKVFGLRVSVPNRFREPDIIYEVSKLYVVNCLHRMILKSGGKKRIITRKSIVQEQLIGLSISFAFLSSC